MRPVSQLIDRLCAQIRSNAGPQRYIRITNGVYKKYITCMNWIACITWAKCRRERSAFRSWFTSDEVLNQDQIERRVSYTSQSAHGSVWPRLSTSSTWKFKRADQLSLTLIGWRHNNICEWRHGVMTSTNQRQVQRIAALTAETAHDSKEGLIRFISLTLMQWTGVGGG